MEEESVGDGRLDRILVWNRVWLTLLVLTLLGWFVVRGVVNLQGSIDEVRTRWSGDRLVIRSIRGRLLITHMTGETKTGTQVAARLPESIYLVDSEGASIEKAAYDKLDWRTEGRTSGYAPSVGSKVLALYIRLEATEFDDRPAEY